MDNPFPRHSLDDLALHEFTFDDILGEETSGSHPTVMDNVLNLSLKVFSTFMLTIAAMGVLGLVWSLQRIILSALAPLPLHRFHRLESWKQVRLVFAHIILHVLGVGACVIAFSTLFDKDIHTNDNKTTPRFVGLHWYDVYCGFWPYRSCLRFHALPFYSYPRPYPPEFYNTWLN
jgi:hypothetical protein